MQISANALDKQSRILYILAAKSRVNTKKASTMKTWRKILLLWVGLMLTYAGSILFLPHGQIGGIDFLNRSIQALLFFVSLYLFLREPNRKNKFIFLNFTIFFFVCILQLLLEFVGAGAILFPSHRYANFFFGEYILLAYVYSLGIAIFYLVIDLMFRDLKIFQKYLVTFIIITVSFVFLFKDFLRNPMYPYETEAIQQWKSLSKVIPESGEIPSAVELANQVTLQSWKDGKAVGDLYPAENVSRIEDLRPYLQGENWQVLFWTPLYKLTIGSNVALIFFIILFFGYQYKKDPPQGAYIDKIMFLFLLFCSMEILHTWGFMNSVEWSSLTQMFRIGLFVTLIIEMLIALFFGLRLRFITSVQGEFYETELATNPQQVSRWRDWLDNLVLSQFFNFKMFNGRLFQNSSEK